MADTPISRELLGKIVDEVFDGAIEDASVIEEIYAAIKRHETPSPSPQMAVTDEMATTYKAAFRVVFDRWLNDEGGIPQENIGLIATKAGLQAVFDAIASEGHS
jgi:hypothetical protein